MFFSEPQPDSASQSVLIRRHNTKLVCFRIHKHIRYISRYTTIRGYMSGDTILIGCVPGHTTLEVCDQETQRFLGWLSGGTKQTVCVSRDTILCLGGFKVIFVVLASIHSEECPKKFKPCLTSRLKVIKLWLRNKN